MTAALEARTAIWFCSRFFFFIVLVKNNRIAVVAHLNAKTSSRSCLKPGMHADDGTGLARAEMTGLTQPQTRKDKTFISCFAQNKNLNSEQQ